MSDKFKNSKFMKKLRDANVNRATVITASVLLVAMAVIIGVTVASNRSKKNDTQPPVSSTTKAPSSTTQKVPDQTTEQKPADTTAPPSNVSKPTGDELPSMSLPVKGVLSKGHDATVQVYSSTMNDYRVHLGLDIVTEENAPVYAAADGKITQIWEDVKMGYCMAIEHTGDCVTIYKNLGETLPEGISEGVSVRAGQLIATVGNSAMIEIAEEPHLHFEMTVGGLSVDPREYYDEQSLETLGIDVSYGE